jgi:hypothetical protein
MTAQLPTIGGSEGQWGTDLNDYLGSQHSSDGTHTGFVVQTATTQTGTVATGTTQIPADNTKPQNTEGDEYVTLSITPTSATNKLIIDFTGMFFNGAVIAKKFSVALFQDSTADAIAATSTTLDAGAGWGETIRLRHVMTAGTTSATTFKIRAGANAAGTTTFNGTGGLGMFNGVCSSGIVIQEIQV